MLTKLSIFYFKKKRWRFVGVLPRRVPKSIIVYGPHTSHTDFAIGRAVSVLSKFHFTTLIKKKHVRWPFKKALGSWRTHPFVGHDSVDFESFVEKGMASKGHFSIAIPFQWITAKESNHWVHDLALKHEIPIVPVAFVYDKKIVKIHAWFTPTNNKRSEWQFVRKFLSRYNGKNEGLNIDRNVDKEF